jgi:hypothetical protein
VREVRAEDAAHIAFEAAVALESAAGECKSRNAAALRAEAARLSKMGELLLSSDHEALARMLGEPSQFRAHGTAHDALPEVWVHRARAAAVRDYNAEPHRWTRRELQLARSATVFEFGGDAVIKLAATVEDAQLQGKLPRGPRFADEAWRQIGRVYLARMGELAGPGPHHDDDEDDGSDLEDQGG